MRQKTLVRILLVVILLTAYALRVWRLAEPSDYYFDEVYHAFTAAAYAVNDPSGYEWWHQAPEGVAYEWLHPPISKLLMGFSIHLLGNNSFAWRLPSAIFGMLTIYATYLLSMSLTKNKWLSLISALVASMDGLLLTQSRIAMNDIFVTCFILLALTAYWQYFKHSKIDWLWWSGVFTGLAVSTKWSGIFLLGIFGIWELVRLVQRRKCYSVTLLCQTVFILLVLPAAIYIGSFSQFWIQGHTIEQFKELHRQIWWYQTHLEATHPYQSRPWQWMLDLKPVWYYVHYTNDKISNIYALANPAVAWLGLLSISCLAVWSALKKKPFGLYLTTAYLLLWTPWFFSPRIMFFYHYTPAIPLLAISIGWLLAQLWQYNSYTKTLAASLLSVISCLFIYFYPHWTGMPVSKAQVDRYQWFESWR